MYQYTTIDAQTTYLCALLVGSPPKEKLAAFLSLFLYKMFDKPTKFYFYIGKDSSAAGGAALEILQSCGRKI